MTQKSRPGQGSRNSERKAKGNMSREDATEEKTFDFRRRTSADVSGGRCVRRPRVARVVASRGLELEVTIRGSGTPAASASARHCEATGGSLPREERPHENAWGVSLLGTRCAVGRMAGWSVDCSCCWHFALNDERQRSELRTDDRRQRTEDGGCMSLCMLQPSSFVFCPLSFVLSTPKPRNPKPETRNPKLETRNQKLETLRACLSCWKMLQFSRLRERTKNRIACNSHNKPAGRMKSKLEKFLKFFNGHLEFSASRGLL